jgi:ankyrin repeat protein
MASSDPPPKPCVLYQNIRGGKIAVVRKYLNRNGDPNYETNYYRKTPLHAAAANGKTKIARLLLDFGARVDTMDKDGVTALMLAALNNHVAVLSLLIDCGASIFRSDKEERQALHHACHGGALQAVERLLNAGAEPFDDLTLLAASSGNLQLVEFLLSQGFVTVPTNFLQAVVFSNNFDLLQNVLSDESKVDFGTSNRQRMIELAILQACVQGRYSTKMISFLLGMADCPHLDDIRADVGDLYYSTNFEDFRSRNFYPNENACAHAVLHGDPQKIKYLCGLGATLVIRGGHPLVVATRYNDRELVQMCLEKGADVNAVGTGTLRTALQTAVRSRLPDLVDYLLRNGANVHMRDSENHNAFYYCLYERCFSLAQYENKFLIFKMLLMSGADPSSYGRPCLPIQDGGAYNSFRIMNHMYNFQLNWTLGPRGNMNKMPPFITSRAYVFLLALKRQNILPYDVICRIFSHCKLRFPCSVTYKIF